MTRPPASERLQRVCGIRGASSELSGCVGATKTEKTRLKVCRSSNYRLQKTSTESGHYERGGNDD